MLILRIVATTKGEASETIAQELQTEIETIYILSLYNKNFGLLLKCPHVSSEANRINRKTRKGYIQNIGSINFLRHGLHLAHHILEF